MADWPDLIRLAAVRFSIPPEAFWRLSVKEWAALSAPPPTDALGRKAFETLMTAHPDPRPAYPAESGGPVPSSERVTVQA